MQRKTSQLQTDEYNTQQAAFNTPTKPNGRLTLNGNTR